MKKTSLLLGTGLLLMSPWAHATIVHSTDSEITASLCVGFDCVSGESYGFDTIRLKENNLRIHFQDTSSSAGFPTNDWRIIANDTANGGASYLAIEDSDTGRQIFRVTAGAPANSLFVSSAGNVGLGTSNPVVELQIADGDSPTVRLEQNGSSGFTPQTWDMAGNETNFFVRDVTNGSKLPFRIRPNAATSSIDIGANGDIGIGRASISGIKMALKNNGYVTTRLENASKGVSWDTTNAGNGNYRVNNDDNTGIEFEITQTGDIGFGTSPAAGVKMHLANAGYLTTRLENSAAGVSWDMTNSSTGLYRINTPSGAGTELELDTSGNLTILGNITVGTAGSSIPDYVFNDDYKLRPLSEVEAFIEAEGHLPGIPSATELNQSGRLDMTRMQLILVEKVEELTLYILEQDRTIKQLSNKLKRMESNNKSGQ